MNETVPLPWHEDNWRMLMDALAAGRLAHALLLAGPAGLGKGQFTMRFSQALLCQARADDGRACGQCQSCQLFQVGNHPDFKAVEPVEDKKVIIVDQIREMTEFLSLKSQYGHYRCIRIMPADRMNESAANSLLKTLEEPPPGTVLMLVTDRPARISATLRSRCQKITFGLPERASALAWLRPRLPEPVQKEADVLLALANGAPLAALELGADDLVTHRRPMLEDMERLLARQGDPVAIADKWLKLDAKASLYWLYSWLVDMARLKMAGAEPHLANPDFREDLRRISELIDVTDILSIISHVERAVLQVEGQINQQLLLEDLLIACQAGSQKNEMNPVI